RSLGDAPARALRITLLLATRPAARRGTPGHRELGSSLASGWCGQAHVGQTPWPLVSMVGRGPTSVKLRPRVRVWRSCESPGRTLDLVARDRRPPLLYATEPFNV